MPATFIAMGVKMGVGNAGTTPVVVSQLPSLGAGR